MISNKTKRNETVVIAKNNESFWSVYFALALNLTFSPGEGTAIGYFRVCGYPFGKSWRRYFKKAVVHSPSSRGEGRDEGGRSQTNSFLQLPSPVSCPRERTCVRPYSDNSC
jgi:hypothetical protein